jgi:hypothetical protein
MARASSRSSAKFTRNSEQPSSKPTAEARAAPLPAGIVDPAKLPFFLTADEVASLLRTTRKAVYARAERGLLPGLIHDGRRILVRRDVLMRSLSEDRELPGFRRRAV